jgi:ABC-type oligopeptide transport system ATPase subunit
MLRLDNVTKRYRVGTFGSRELVAVRDVSLEVRPGEVVALIGQSGSGKSTIGRMILRLTPASGGAIRFDGADVAGFKGARLRAYYADVQGVFQDPFSSFNPVFKADRTLELVRETYFPRLGERAWRDKVEAALAAVRLDPGQVLGKYPHQLSGGQLQRLLVARALLLDIRLLVADEIISMLDASTRIDVLNLLGDLKARGLGILFITHDLSLGNYLSDTAVILHRGQVVETGPAERVLTRPAHPCTRSLLASVPQLHHKWERTGHGVFEPAGEGG